MNIVYWRHRRRWGELFSEALHCVVITGAACDAPNDSNQENKCRDWQEVKEEKKSSTTTPTLCLSVTVACVSPSVCEGDKYVCRLSCLLRALIRVSQRETSTRIREQELQTEQHISSLLILATLILVWNDVMRLQHDKTVLLALQIDLLRLNKCFY